MTKRKLSTKSRHWGQCPHQGGVLWYMDLDLLVIDVYINERTGLWTVQVVEACGSIDSVKRHPSEFRELKRAKRAGISLARRMLRRAARKLDRASKELRSKKSKR